MVAPRKPCREKISSAASRIRSCFSRWIRVCGRGLRGWAGRLVGLVLSIFALIGGMGVLTFFQLVKFLDKPPAPVKGTFVETEQ